MDLENSCKKSAKKVLTNPRMNGIITKLFRKRQRALRKEVYQELRSLKKSQKSA